MESPRYIYVVDMTFAGASRVTMADVARVAGVSVMTVSYCYNQPGRVATRTRNAVAQAAQSLGYLGPDPAARSLRNGRTGSVGVVLGEHLAYAFDDPQARQFLTGVAAVCRHRGVGMTLIPTTTDERDGARVRAAAVDGFIIWTTVDSDPIIPAALSLDKPVVVHGGPDVQGTHLVAIDDRAAARAISAAVFDGAKRPAVVSFPLNAARESGLTPPELAEITFPVTRNRLLGVHDYCAATGIDSTKLVVAVTSRNERATSRDIIDTLLDLPDPPDAVMAMSDELAFEVAAALKKRDLSIPYDVSISGWDDSPGADAAGLTTVRQSLFEQGQQCARLALSDDNMWQQPAWQVVLRQTTRTKLDLQPAP